MLRLAPGALLLALLVLCPGLSVATVHVVVAGSGSIQPVIDAAAPGDTLRLSGNFSGAGNVGLDPAGKDLVYLASEATGATFTAGGQTVFFFRSGETAATRVSGITFLGSSNAILCDGASPTLSKLDFTGNYGSPSSGVGGAGLRCENGASPLVDGCAFSSNAHLRGAGACVLSGAAPSFLDCDFSNNSAALGGAVYVDDASPLFVDCVFAGNTAYPLADVGGTLVGGDGGAVLATGGQPVLTRCVWTGNTSHAQDGTPDLGGHGGALAFVGVATARLGGSTLHDNAAEREGGGVYLAGSATAELDSSLVTLNLPEGLFGAESGALDIACCDVWGDGAPGYGGTLADATGLDGNLGEDPIYCDAVGGALPLGLHESSPCLPAGNACGVRIGAYGQACAGNIHRHEVPLEYATIQAALNVAVTGDSIIVAPGTYAGAGNVDLNPQGKDVVLLGAGPALSIIDGGQASRGLLIATGETAAMTVSGFTIKGCRYALGPAITCIGASPTLENLILRDNISLSDGGALVCINASPRLTDVLIHDNTAFDDGGGMFCASGGSPQLTRVLFFDNDATGNGGAIYAQGASPSLLDCTVAFNNADLGGAGLWLQQGGLCTLERSIVTFGYGGGGIHVETGALLQASCSNVFGNGGGDWSGDAVDPQGADGNLSADPLFCAPSTRDFHLDQDSPCAAANNACAVDMGIYGVACDNVHHAISGRLLTAGGVPVEGIGVYGSYYEAHTDSNGAYTILVPDQWSGNVLPLAVLYTFEPTLRHYDLVGADIPDQDFLAIRERLHRVPSEYPSIAAGLAVSVDGDTVLVAPGSYDGDDNRRLDFLGRNIALLSEGGAAQTVIECGGAGRALNFENGEGPASVVDGFTIRGGHVFYEWESSSGGGIRVSGASPTLRNLVIEDCRAKSAGGGIAMANSASLVENVVLRHNQAYDVAYGNGGGLAVFGGSPTFTGLLVHHNVATEAGGGVYLSGGTASLVEATVGDNQAQRGGGLGLAYAATPSLERLLVTGNSAGSGAALHAADSPSAPVWACSDIFDNGPSPFGGFASAPSGDNFSLDPLYCTLGNENYSLSEQSPCMPDNNDCGLQVGAVGIGCTLTEAEGGPAAFYLAPNHPNPFNPATMLRFGLPRQASVTLRIFDVLGREVATPLADVTLPAGEHRLRWEGRGADGRPLPSGVYLARLEALGQIATRSMLLVK